MQRYPLIITPALNSRFFQIGVFMKSFMFVCAALVVSSAAFGQAIETQVCDQADKCGVTAQSVKELNQGRGLSECGVIVGEKTVKVVTSQGELVGYACVMTSPF